MKIGVISDIHGYPPLERDKKLLSECGLVCICGDIFEGKTLNVLANKQILEWVKSLTSNGTRVVATPGNHDLMLYRGWLEKNNRHPLDTYCDGIYTVASLDPQTITDYCGMEILIDEGTEVNGIKIWGTPDCNRFCNWAWMFESEKLMEKFSKIPNNVDILLSHTPPLIENSDIDVSDYDRSKHCGSIELTDSIFKKNPRFVFCGHIHSGNHDPLKVKNTTIINVSYVNERYTPFYKPYVMGI